MYFVINGKLDSNWYQNISEREPISLGLFREYLWHRQAKMYGCVFSSNPSTYTCSLAGLPCVELKQLYIYYPDDVLSLQLPFTIRNRQPPYGAQVQETIENITHLSLKTAPSSNSCRFDINASNHMVEEHILVMIMLSNKIYRYNLRVERHARVILWKS